VGLGVGFGGWGAGVSGGWRGQGFTQLERPTGHIELSHRRSHVAPPIHPFNPHLNIRHPSPPHTPRFLVQNILRSEQESGVRFDPLAVDLDTADNVLDKWVPLC